MMSVQREKISRQARFYWKRGWSLWTRSQMLAVLVVVSKW